MRFRGPERKTRGSWTRERKTVTTRAPLRPWGKRPRWMIPRIHREMLRISKKLSLYLLTVISMRSLTFCLRPNQYLCPLHLCNKICSRQVPLRAPQKAVLLRSSVPRWRPLCGDGIETKPFRRMVSWVPTGLQSYYPEKKCSSSLWSLLPL